MNKRPRMAEIELEGVTPRARGGSSFCNGFLAFCKASPQTAQPPILHLANENPEIPAEVAGGMPLIGLANDFTVLQDKWLLIPYAEAPITVLRKRYLQRLDLANAQAIVSRFHSWRGKITRQFGGLPFYVGHPDVAAFANEHKDTKAYGWIKDLEARHDALAMFVEWSDAGQLLLANAHYKWFSPYFLGRKSGEANGMPVAEPLWLASCGLTNKPNWPVYPLANEDNNKGGDMNLLARLIAILGLEGGASEDDLVSAFTKLVEAARKIKEAVEAKWDAEDAAREALPNEMPVDEAIGKVLVLVGDGELALANTTAANAELETGLTAEKEARTAAEESLKAERKERIVLLVNEALTSGKILPADKDKWLKDLDDDFGTNLEVLANARPALKTKQKTKDLGPRGSKTVARQDEILELVNEKMDKTKKSYQDAWVAVKKEHPELFADETQGDK